MSLAPAAALEPSDAEFAPPVVIEAAATSAKQAIEHVAANARQNGTARRQGCACPHKDMALAA